MPRYRTIGPVPAAREAAGCVRHLASTAAVAAALTMALHSGSVLAQQAPAAKKEAQLEEVIVTARKRSEDVQTVPQTIDVLGGLDLQEMGKVTFKDLQFEVPGFYVENYESRATITMRGVGAQVPGNGASVATHVDGIYQASTAASLGWLFDVDRVEVLKGPQGTLYGRNSTGGAVNIITRRPGSELDAGGSLEYGSNGMVRVEGAMDAPFGSGWAVRVAGLVNREDGRITNEYTGRKIDGNDFTGGRVTLAGKAGSVDVDLFGQYTDEQGGSGEVIPLNASAQPRYGWNKSYYDLPTKPQMERQAYLVGLTLTSDIGNGYTWKSVTGYLHYKEPKSFLDVNPQPAPVQLTIRFPQYARQISEEFQVLYTGERLNWVVGALYMDADEGEQRLVDIQPVLPGALDSNTDNTTKTTALFGDLNYKLTDQLRLNAGLRYNSDKVHNRFDGRGAFDGQSFDLSSTQSEPTGRLGLDYTLSSGTMFYASIAKGFQSGYNDVGFDLNGNPEPATVKPENLWAYELGMKSRLPNDLGLFNLAGFYYDYKDMQVLVGGIPLLPDGTPDPNGVPFYTTLNAGKAKIYGADAALTVVPTQHLKLELNAEFLDATFKEYQSIDDFGAPADYSGNNLPRAPKFAGTAAVIINNVAFGSADASLRLEYQYRSEAYDNADNLYKLQSTGLLNAVATLDIDKWRVWAGGRNLTDKHYFAFYDGRNFAYPGNFRTWSVGASYNFH